LVTVMRDKQRYFALEDASGKLMPYFIAVRNGDDQHLDKVTDGNEQVLRARFSDANYFFTQDTQKKLADFLPRLGTLTFQEKLGSMLDKNNRVAALVKPVGERLGAESADVETAAAAARVLKADLATQMVIEMTSLQGTMGREYALLSGYPKGVANAIYEHWLPRGSGDALPESQAGMLLAITDRLDSLVGLFAAGLAPRSNADPYGLRRAALGVIQILVARQIDVDVSNAEDGGLLGSVAQQQPLDVSQESVREVAAFIDGRLKAWIEEQDYPADVIAAAHSGAASLNPYRFLLNLGELAAWVKEDRWQQILEGFARCVRITRAEAEQYPIDEQLLSEPSEIRLYDAYRHAMSQMDDTRSVDTFLTAFEPMLPAVTDFFDTVLVNTEDQTVRKNRLGLLQAISAMQNGSADLSQLVGF
ncbi:MAG: glycine--tRNA ligase subunit beta, partial [Anaerolineae bacterium]|nr:glycine--tRNA ligase subunit beta [Anaerolineae bacterium]